MADVYIDYEESGKKYFNRAMFINLLLSTGGAMMVLYLLTDIIIVIIVGILGIGVAISYLIYYLVTNPPLQHPEESF